MYNIISQTFDNKLWNLLLIIIIYVYGGATCRGNWEVTAVITNNFF